MAKPKVWIFTTSDERPIRDIAKDLANGGLIGSQILEDIGVITGSAGDQVVAKLRNVRGVVDVSPDAPINIGPPDSPNTW